VDTLGHTYVKAIFYNASDYIQYLEGRLRLSDVRKAEVEALVDAGATFPGTARGNNRRARFAELG